MLQLLQLPFSRHPESLQMERQSQIIDINISYT